MIEVLESVVVIEVLESVGVLGFVVVLPYVVVLKSEMWTKHSKMDFQTLLHLLHF